MRYLFFFDFLFCPFKNYMRPMPNAIEIIISIMATSVCINFNVTFFSSLLPIYEPAIPASVALSTNVRFSCNPAFVNRVA